MDVRLASMFVLMVSMTAVQSQIQKGPVNALKIVGDRVTLECVTSSKDCDNVEWMKMEGAQSPLTVYKDGIGMLNTEAFPSARYNVSSTGGCNLTITQLKISDSGRFSCALTMGDTEVKRSSMLVVINVTESCLSNMTESKMNQSDVYSFWTAISVDLLLKSVELSFHNKTVDEIETTENYSQPQTVRTILTGKAWKEDVMPRVCRASFTPVAQAHSDGTTATLDICTTQQLTVSYGHSRTSDTANGAADGRPFIKLLLLLLCAYKMSLLFIGAS